MDVTGFITLGEGKEMVMPGDNTTVKIRKIKKEEREEVKDFVRLGALTHLPPSLPPSLPSSPGVAHLPHRVERGAPVRGPGRRPHCRRRGGGQVDQVI